jgi:hypothetical protein
LSVEFDFDLLLFFQSVFAVATLDSNIDVHDRAYLYYRLFARSLEDARKIIAAPKVWKKEKKN